ncbi:hypothetical protein HY632_05025 [Candidatus Uhrbacteria bacterium]|nr:hypothetical protein [Candidatus Uhrbacteria bacterium]
MADADANPVVRRPKSNVALWGAGAILLLIVSGIFLVQGNGGCDGRQDVPDATTPAGRAPLTVLMDACVGLWESTPETVRARYEAAQLAAAQYIERDDVLPGLPQLMGGRPIEGLLTACRSVLPTAATSAAPDVDPSEVQRVVWIMLHDDALKTRLDDEYRHSCEMEIVYAEARATEPSAPWTEDQRESWKENCLRFHRGIPLPRAPAASTAPDAGSGPFIPLAAPPAETPRVGACDVDTLRTHRDAITKSDADKARVVTYARALAACTPAAKPWTALGLESEEAFYGRYVDPLNRVHHWLQDEQPDLYDMILDRWSPDG